MEVQENTFHEEILLPDSLLKDLSSNQKLLLTTLAKHRDGILSNELTHVTRISNKSDTLKLSVRELLAKYGLEIHTKRSSIKKQWLWSLRLISSGEQS